MAKYFYDSQIRRFLTQFIAIFSNFDVQYGSDPQGNPILHRVPVMWGDPSRQAAATTANNSASTMPSAPMMTVNISGIEYDQRRTQDPYFLDKVNVRQRTLNQQTGQYETTQGNAFTVERIMPVPYTLRVSVDIWTTSTQQKLELFEQLGVLFNPSMEIQSTDNFLDWTSLSVIYQDGISWSSRSIPQGSSNAIDVMNWKFYMPVWVSSAIKVKKLGMIQKIIASIHKGSAVEDMANDTLLLGTRQKITPYGYKLLLIGDKLQVLPASEVFVPSNNEFDLPSTGPNTDIYWQSFLNVYGVIRPGVSMIAIENPYIQTEILGTIDFDPLDDRLLTYTIDPDTLPINTLAAVDSVINPDAKWPGVSLPISDIAQRYLIVNPIPEQVLVAGPLSLGSNWPGLIDGANANDIVEYGLHVTTNLAYTSATGSYDINMQTVSGIDIGYVVTYADTGMPVGTVVAVDYHGKVVTVDTPLPVTVRAGEGMWTGTALNFTGTGWFVVYDSVNSSTIDYVTNTTTNIQYRFIDGGWQKSYEGWIDQGNFRIIL